MGNDTFYTAGKVSVGTSTPGANDTMTLVGTTTNTLAASNSAAAGAALVGASTGTGTNYGVFGQNSNASGFGVGGINTAATGAGTGVVGQSLSATGRGVAGFASGTTSTSAGVLGSTNGSTQTGVVGVLGVASATTGNNSGVQGQNSSTTGGNSGVSGFALGTSTTATSFGVYGQTASNFFSGSSSLGSAGVFGTAGGTVAAGIYGWNSQASTAGANGAPGVYGESFANNGYGVYGVNNWQTGAGVRGTTSSTAGFGLWGSNSSTSTSSTGAGVRAEHAVASAAGVSLWVRGGGASFGEFGRIGFGDTPTGTSPRVAIDEDVDDNLRLTVANQTGSRIYMAVGSSGGLTVGTTVAGAFTAGAGNFIRVSSATGAFVTGTTWTNASDRALKENFQTLDTQDILNRVVSMPVTQWNYIEEGVAIQHIGPMAQDFFGRFGLGYDNRSITTLDASGVALAAIQGLARRLDENLGVGMRIDDPTDPERSILTHAAVASPEYKNVYDGTITLDSAGRAIVTLPDYVSALNTDFRYQLTCVGGFAPVYVASEVANNRFTIAGGLSGLKVSWQVTGLRKDAQARANPLTVRRAKTISEIDLYVHPAAFGKTSLSAIGYVPNNPGAEALSASIERYRREQAERTMQESTRGMPAKGVEPLAPPGPPKPRVPSPTNAPNLDALIAPAQGERAAR